MLVLALAVPFALAGCNIDGRFGDDRSRVVVVLSGDNAIASSALAASMSASNGGDDDDDDRNDHSRLSSWFTSAQVTPSSVMFRTLDHRSRTGANASDDRRRARDPDVSVAMNRMRGQRAARI